MTIDPLVTILRDFAPNKPFVSQEGRTELATRIALNAFSATGGSETSLRERLTIIRETHSDLDVKITQFESLLDKVHEKTKAELESEFDLAGLDAGPNTEEAKKRILNCYLNEIPTLFLNNLQLTSLPPLRSSITLLDCSNNQLTTLPTLPASLIKLECSRNQLTSLPDFPASLIKLSCSRNQLTTLPGLPASLTQLSCFSNQLTSLPGLPASLTQLSCFSNQLISLPNLPACLIKLSCANNRLTTLPGLPASLTDLSCANNRLTSLPSLPDSITWLDCSNNQLTVLPLFPSESIIYSIGNPLLAEVHAPALILGASTVKFKIPKGTGPEPLWCSVLMDVAREHQGEDYSLLVDAYKIWGNETSSTITIKQIEGDEALVFRFDENTGSLASVKDQNGVDVPLMDLKEGNGWNAILNRFANHILKERGIKVEGTTIKVHPEALKKFPGEILERLTPSVTNVRYLNDDFMPNMAIDAGGVSRQYMSDLCKALFIGSDEDPPLIHVTEEGDPDFKDEEAEIYRNFGKILSFVLKNPNPLITGVYFNPKFYLLLKRAQSGLSLNQVAADVVREILPQKADLIQVLNWYNNHSCDSKPQVTSYLNDVYGSEFVAESTDSEILAEIESTVLDAGRKKAQAILTVLEGITPEVKAMLAAIPDTEISTRIQGNPVSAEGLKAAIKMEVDLSPAALEKRNWILERIDEKAGDLKWLSSFVHFITGQPFLPVHSEVAPPITLKFLDLPNFNAHTCFNMLDVPINVASKEEFLAALDLCIQDPTIFTTA